MTATQPTLTSLAQSGAWRVLEDRWLTAIEVGGEQQEDLLEALAELNRARRGDQAAAMAWTWLASVREKAPAAEVLTLGRELILRCSDNDEMRSEILRLYEEVFADRPELKQLIDVSGLRGGKSPRRALRTLEICLGLKVGDCLLARSDEQVVEVAEIDANVCLYTLKTRKGQITLEPDALALAYDPVDPNDFRVLSQLRPQQVAQMLETDPVALVTGILMSHHGRLDSDQLEHLLTPAFLTPDRWSGWWSKAKTALKRSPNIVVEGRNPIILTYNAQGQTLEEEIEGQWARAESPPQRLATVDTYLREAKARGQQVSPNLIGRIHRDLMTRVNSARRGAPAEALAEALIVERLAEQVALPEGATPPARQIITDAPDIITLLRGMEEPVFFVRVIAQVKQAMPDRWPDILAQLLPLAPVEGCEAIAKAMNDAGHREQLERAVQSIPTDFTPHLDAVCWLWRGSSVAGLDPLPPRELVLRILSHLAELTRDDQAPADVLRDARLKIRAALSASKFARYREVIEGMDAGLASTVRRTVDRLDGLGQVVRSTLLRIIQETHPELYVQAKIDPWLDERIIFGTQPGMHRREEEMNHLVNVKMRENAKAIGEAASHGDLSENSEYKFALEERDLLRARVAQIQQELSLARLLTEHDVSTDSVTVGTRVTLQSTAGDQRQQMTILGPWEADIEKGIYNYRAPLSTKLRGLQVGDVVALDLDGTEREYRIETIENALEGTAGR